MIPVEWQLHSSTTGKTSQATTIPCSNCNNTWQHKKHFIALLPKINNPKQTNPATTTPNRNAHHTSTTITLMEHNEGPPCQCFHSNQYDNGNQHAPCPNHPSYHRTSNYNTVCPTSTNHGQNSDHE